MHPNCHRVFEVVILVILTLIIHSSGNTNYHVFVGRTFSSDPEFTIVSNSKTQCLMSLRALANDFVHTIAVYNEVSKSCTKYSTGSQTLFLQETGNNEIVALWNENVCPLFSRPDSVFYEYKDTDLLSYDITIQDVSSPTDCAHLCENNHGNAFKGFVYGYIGTTRCWCKSVSENEFQDLGNSLSYLSGYSYYSRLCYI